MLPVSLMLSSVGPSVERLKNAKPILSDMVGWPRRPPKWWGGVYDLATGSVAWV